MDTQEDRNEPAKIFQAGVEDARSGAALKNPYAATDWRSKTYANGFDLGLKIGAHEAQLAAQTPGGGA